MEPSGPERPGLPTGPHPTVGPDTVRMPGWPGPVLAVGGAVLAIAALGVAVLVDEGWIPVEDRSILLVALVVGALAFVAGVLYAAIRQLRVRRHLPPERYRGPAILLLLLLVLVGAGIVTAPFAADAGVLTGDDGELSRLGAVVLLMSTQAMLLGVSWMFVLRPRALAGSPSWLGRDPVGAARAGIGWGVVAWIAATAVSAVVVVVLDELGVSTDPEPAERALALIDPWLAVAAIVILAPIAEELFFRGIVFNAWLRERGQRFAYVGSAALFAVIHFSIASLVPIFLLGLALAWVYRRTGTLLAPILMHATVNGISVAIALLAQFEMLPMPA